MTAMIRSIPRGARPPVSPAEPSGFPPAVALRSRFLLRAAAAVLLGLAACGGSPTDDGPVGPAPGTVQLTFESGPVRPLALSSDGSRVFVANTPNGSLDILRVTAAGLVPDGSVKVGIDPVAVAVRNDGEVWVVNHMSDSVSIVDVAHAPPRVVRTLLVGDEPGDLVFAGAGRAFIATAHRGQQRSSPDLAAVPGAGDPELTMPGVGRADVWVFDPANLGSVLGGQPVAIVTLFGDTARGLAVSPDGATVYAAVFHSGNQTTPVSAALPCAGAVDSDKPCMVSGQTIPGSQLGPATNHAGVAAPRVGLIVKQDAAGAWRDARSRDWSAVTEFQLADQDVFAIDAAALTTRQSFPHVGTTLFNLAVNPKSGAVYVSNTEARNDLRFEGPGTFAPGVTLQGHLAETRITVIGSDLSVKPRHLNKHIDYAVRPAPAGVKDHSLSTPVGLAVSADGATLYVAALGSGKIGVLSTAELEADTFDPVAASAGYIPVTGGGPSGVVLDGHGHLVVATRFDDGVSLIDLASRAETSHVALTNPEPARITAGRRFLYDAQVSSSNGEAACASCHMFGDTDHLVWDLGNPDGDVVQTPVTIKLGFGSPRTINGTGDPARLHPMKGPMATQTLRGMVNHGAMHWRGDRVDGVFGRDTRTDPPYDAELAFKNFIVAFDGLLGNGAAFAPDDMQAFADFALAIVMPPNPVRSLDNALTATQQSGRAFFMGCAGLDSETGGPVVCTPDGRPTTAGHFADGAGVAGLGFTCEGCHVLRPEQGFFGTDGEMSFEALPQTVKVPQLRNLYTKVGMFGMPAIPGDNPGNNGNQGAQIRGSGYQHDGSVDTIFRFLQARVFNPTANGQVGFAGGDLQRRDVEQYLLAFDTDLAPIVGQQATLDASNAAAVGPRIDLLIARARAPFASKLLGPGATECDLVARGVVGGRAVTFALRGDGRFTPDDGGPAQSDAAVRALAAVDGQQITYTCLPPGWPR
jgi:DNA-binding beta-propeller fold protein YncE